jgi:hypothetical protein
LPPEVLDAKVVAASIAGPKYSELLPIPYMFNVEHRPGHYVCRAATDADVSDLDFRRLISQLTVSVDYPLANAVLTRRSRGALGFRDPFVPKGFWRRSQEREATLEIELSRGAWRYPLSRSFAEALRRHPYMPDTLITATYYPRLDPERRSARDRFFPDGA